MIINLNSFMDMVDRHILHSYKRPKNYDDVATREQFLWIPIMIDGKIKWLVNAKWEQVATQEDGTFFSSGLLTWKNSEWIEDDK